MPISVSHVYTSPIADGTNTQLVRPSDWNSSHQVSVSLAANEVIKYISAGTNAVSSGTIVFGSSAGNVTFGMATDGYVTASAPTGGAGGAAISGGTSSQNTGTVVFSNSNGVSFGLSNGVMTATVTPGAAAGIAAIGAGSQTQTSGTMVFANSNGITFGLSNNGTMTASVSAPPAQTNQTGNLYVTANKIGRASCRERVWYYV